MDGCFSGAKTTPRFLTLFFWFPDSGISLLCSSFCLQGLSGEVVEREGEESEHDDADQVVMQGVVVAEAGNGAMGGGFVEFDADAEEADDASGGDET